MRKDKDGLFSKDRFLVLRWGRVCSTWSAVDSRASWNRWPYLPLLRKSILIKQKGFIVLPEEYML